MTKRLFLLGNGKSRLNFDISILRKYGTVYGCNAIYRTNPDDIDVLCGVDTGISHEIYHSGFAFKKPCYFRNWTKLPKLSYEGCVNGLISKDELEELKEYDIVRENKEYKDQAQEFVIHGTNMKGMVGILRQAQKTHSGRPKEVIQKQINTSQIVVSWIGPDDKSHDLRDVKRDSKDHGWACGAMSGWVGIHRENPDEIYLIGHDLKSNSNEVNNIYAGTKHYVPKQSTPTPHTNWVNQWYTLMDWFRNKKFFKVNEQLDDKPTNRKIGEWDLWEKDTNLNTLRYMTHAQLLDKLSKVGPKND
tara:strand:- start:22 stop:930 length:909 start_codon:yes stop_codon:yes gene_type:complete